MDEDWDKKVWEEVCDGKSINKQDSVAEWDIKGDSKVKRGVEEGGREIKKAKDGKWIIFGREIALSGQ